MKMNVLYYLGFCLNIILSDGWEMGGESVGPQCPACFPKCLKTTLWLTVVKVVIRSNSIWISRVIKDKKVSTWWQIQKGHKTNCEKIGSKINVNYCRQIMSQMINNAIMNNQSWIISAGCEYWP